MFHLYDAMKNGKIYTIAEMSANHAGKLENAIEIIHAAKKSGADCVKIQTYTADTITIDCHDECFTFHGGLWDNRNLYDLYKEAYTPWEWQAKIKEECEKIGIDFLSTPFDKTAVDFLESINCEAYKIASFEIVDLPLIEYTASKMKPMIISCGMASTDEITDAIDTCYKVGNNQVVLLKCCSEYPTNIENLNLSTICDMKNRYSVPIGISDHSMGFMADVVAVSLGAQVIEKHFCLSRELENADSGFSMEPKEFSEMINEVNKTTRMMGNIKYGPSVGEIEEYKCRRSLFVVKDIKAGECLTESNIRSIRPNNGLKPKYLPFVLGKRAKYDLKFGTPLTEDMLED